MAVFVSEDVDTLDELQESVVSSMAPSDILACRELFEILEEMHPNGYKPSSISAVATKTSLFFWALQDTYQDNPPDAYKSDYADLHDAVRDFRIDPETSGYIAIAENALNSMRNYIQRNFAGNYPPCDTVYVYQIFERVVNPYLMRMGLEEINSNEVLAQMHGALSKWVFPVSRDAGYLN